MQKKENKIREKYEEDLLKAKNKRNMEFDKKEKNIKELKKKLFNEAREKEKKLFLKRKNEINGQLEKTKKFINEKVQKTDKDYLFYRYQEDFEKKEKKLIDKINMTKKEPLVTQEQLKELAEKINQQKKYLQDNADEKKKQMQKLWTYRSQTLPTYRHPLTVKAEEEKIKKLNDEEEEKKKKECNQLEKINYKPPSVKINKKLKQIREKRINPNSKEMLLETELNNKKRINEMRFTPIHSNKNPIIKDERSIELNNNNFINLIEVKNSLTKKSKKKLKPIQILHPKPDKPIDYLKEMKEKRNKSSEEEKKKSINFDDLFKPEQKNENILESLEVAKIRTNTIDKKIERKKEIMNVNGGYLKNPNLAGEIGDLLVESIQAKLQLVNKLGGEEES
jgi:nucleolar protein involved in exit from mitosis